ncbi:MAG: FAD-dependent oxidoreductase [Phycisphaerae bacterium]|nr:FAD-dependent oxidoreductase [Phycisphaerae bacterium]NIP52599.1 FAD-dependent oxidoreductase [Phycisphaerae bacterium]NIS51583.1 FAD-dependent oxidoreductase [Phycisphaerae bacterium]NIU09168.1 FAD-dependent oxidoreductase [Phycisphaerae bacterium]NIU56832.1 FAD-dependent oxidoreductase [Phycisphaerae bacterium]
MNRRDFHKHMVMLGIGVQGSSAMGKSTGERKQVGSYYQEPSKKLPIRKFDVVVAGAGTAGVVAALAAAKQGAKTMLIERKGYTGGTVTEGGTALHSFYNLWKAFPGVKKRQVVRGIPQQIIDRLMAAGACSGHAEMVRGYNYDSVCTAIDTELYKLVTMQMLDEAGVFIAVNTLLTGAIMDGSRIRGAIVDSRSGREAIYARAFVDCSAYGDLAAFAGADYKVPNDYACCNSIGLANVDLDGYVAHLDAHGGSNQLAYGVRSGQPGKVVRFNGGLGGEFQKEARKIGMSSMITTVHDNYLMFVKCNFKVPGSVINRDDMAKAELEVRKRQAKAVELFRKYVPGCKKAFMARTSPTLNIRRGRLITCDYDISHEDVIEARHFDDEVMVYGFHDSAPRYQIKNGGTYGFPYRALRVAGIENLLASGMLITSDHRAHMSTRNTVCCMGQGQASGTAAALCAAKNCGTRELKYANLREALEKGGVYFES